MTSSGVETTEASLTPSVVTPAVALGPTPLTDDPAAPQAPATPEPAAHPERPAVDLLLADLAIHAARATPGALPGLLADRCEWSRALPPAAARQFADQTCRVVRDAAPATLPDDLESVLSRWRETARTFGAV